ncbi:hypothetical protein MMC25_001913 [Agyrium rufum]|nr:hypothetical protein [Agyrium rufum]
MNVGSLASAHLKSVNRSTPQLNHQPSQNSIAASDDYYSLSDHISEASGEGDRGTVRRYNTPPSRLHSTHPSRDPIAEREEPEEVERPITQDTVQQTKNARFDEAAIMTDPARSRAWNNSVNVVSPPTPGVDDTPYIHFAIDQLTRDEELTGRRRLRQGSEDSYSYNPYAPPVPSLPTTSVAPQPLAAHPYRTVSHRSRDNGGIPSRRPVPQQTVLSHSSQPPSRVPSKAEFTARVQPSPVITQQPSPTPQQPISRPDANSRLTGGYRPTTSKTTVPSTPTDPDDTLISAASSKSTTQLPTLNYLPTSLRLPAISALIVFCSILAALLIFCAVWSPRHDGLLNYDGVNTPKYFLFEFLPQILSALVILWIHVIQSAVHRIMPFTVLASEQPQQNATALKKMSLFRTKFMVPDLSFFQHGEPLLGFAFLIFWLCLFAVPLQSSTFQTRYFSQWRWITVQPVAIILIILYILEVVALIMVYLRFARKVTGLKWDPVNLADIIDLIPHPAAPRLTDDPNSPLHSTSGSRLGYWSSSKDPKKLFYGFALLASELVDPPAYETKKSPSVATRFFRRKERPVSDEHRTRGLLSPSRPTSYDPAQNMDLEAQKPVASTTAKPKQPLPWYLRPSALVFFLVAAVVLLIGFLVVSFTNNPIKNGFAPLLKAQTSSDGFSPANFLYSFLPSLIGVVIHQTWQPIDQWFRAAQPWAAMNGDQGASAEKSILLDYNSSLPLHTTVKAAAQGDYKVAWTSFVSVITAILPVIGGGVFTAQVFGGQDSSSPSGGDGSSDGNSPSTSSGTVKEGADLPSFYVLAAVVVIYAISFAFIWPGKKRSKIPGDIKTLGGLIEILSGASPSSDTPPTTATTPAKTASVSALNEKAPTRKRTAGGRLVFAPMSTPDVRSGLHGVGVNHTSRIDLRTGLLSGSGRRWKVGEGGYVERGDLQEEGGMF